MPQWRCTWYHRFVSDDDQLFLLLVEDDDNDALLFEQAIRQAGGGVFGMRRVSRVSEALPLLTMGRCDLVVVDLSLPDARGIDAVLAVVKAKPGLPVVVHTGDEDLVYAAMATRHGAQDVLVKGAHQPVDLVRSLVLAIERHARVRDLRSAVRVAEDRVAEMTYRLKRAGVDASAV